MPQTFRMGTADKNALIASLLFARAHCPFGFLISLQSFARNLVGAIPKENRTTLNIKYFYKH